ncbi:hypothetical protein K502DRAFT_342654 [Neoconidiobolus thromboides FSU 785]|nr:hypothetical protein K502DRAFT_342654 [Neoconidiobolus thromboides FSU 785]
MKNKSKYSEIREDVIGNLKIDEDDYYRKNSEFRLWLLENKGKYFMEMNNEDQKKYFKKFVKKWNSGVLEDKFYDGVNSTQFAKEDNTSFKWKFANKIDGSELDRIRDIVDTDTNKHKARQLNMDKKRRVQGPTMPSDFSIKNRTDAILEEEELNAAGRDRKKRENKRLRKDKEVLLEELVPKATGREAMIEKKRMKAAYTKRENSPDVVLDDKELMGGDDFYSTLAKQKSREYQRNTRRQQIEKEKAEQLKQRVASYQAKEEATMDMLRKLAEKFHTKKD